MDYKQYKKKKEVEKEVIESKALEPNSLRIKLKNFIYNKNGISFCVDGWIKSSDAKELMRLFDKP